MIESYAIHATLPIHANPLGVTSSTEMSVKSLTEPYYIVSLSLDQSTQVTGLVLQELAGLPEFDLEARAIRWE